MIDVRKLAMLAALDRLGTIAAVADELTLTPPGISMQLKTLERELGVALTERQGRRVALTPAGKLLAAHGHELVDRLSLAELEIDALRRGAAGKFRVAAFPSAARTFVADAWQQLLGGSGIELDLTTPEPEGALAALAVGATDLAIVHSYSNVPRVVPDGIGTAHIVDEPVWVAIADSDSASAGTVDLAGLERHAWIVPSEDTTCYAMVERACGLAGFRPRIIAQSMDFAVQLALVQAGVGVALVPDFTVAIVPDGVVLRPLRLPVTRRIDAARRVSMHGDAGLDRIVELCREAARRRTTVTVRS